MTARLAQIWLFPIKSLAGVAVTQAQLTAGGALAHDREFALFDGQGKVINAKRTPRIQQLGSAFDLVARTVSLWAEGVSQTFQLDQEQDRLAQFCTEYFGFPVQIRQDLYRGFPDDRSAYGPTLVSRASLAAVAAWYPGLDLNQTRARFRTNLELEGVPAFWEEHLCSAQGEPVPFRLGSVPFLGINPCTRCIVPSRDPQTGEGYPGFQQKFVSQRQATLPDWAPRQRFEHFYKFTVNTRAEAGGWLQVGDVLTCQDAGGGLG